MGKNFQVLLAKHMEDPECVKEWEALAPERQIIQAMINDCSTHNMPDKETTA